MTTEDQTTPAGLSEAPAKFEHKIEADAALSALGQDWPRLQDDAYQAQAAEDTAMAALPKWVREVRSKIAGHEITLRGKGSSEQAKVAAQQAIAGLDTARYRNEIVSLDAAEQRTKDRDDALDKVWERILATPAHTAASALVKLRIGIREIVNNYAGSNGCLPEESEIGIYDRMTLAALADLERLAGADIGPRQAPATTGHSGMSKGVKEEFIALVEELDDIRDTASNMVPGAAYYVLVERVQELDEKMLETRAGTLAGVVWKLKELNRLLDDDSGVPDFASRLAHSAMVDVDALAGEARP